MKEFEKIPSLFGINVFNETAMAKYVSCDAVVAWKQCLKDGTSLQLDTANEIAEGMKNWAIEHGATHFTHWFQPSDRLHRRKARQLHLPRPRAARPLWSSAARSWCAASPTLPLPLRRPPRHLRSPGLHRLGSHLLRLYQGRQPLHSHGVLLLLRRSPGQEDAAAAVHGRGNRQAVRVLRLFGDTTTRRSPPASAPSRSTSWWIKSSTTSAKT